MEAVKAGLGVIALAPVALIFSVILGVLFGGPTGVLVYLFFVKKRKKKKLKHAKK